MSGEAPTQGIWGTCPENCLIPNDKAQWEYDDDEHEWVHRSGKTYEEWRRDYKVTGVQTCALPIYDAFFLEV